MTRPLLFVGLRVRRWQVVGFTVFCLLAGSRWLVENAWPSALPPLLGQGFRFAVTALVAWALWVASRRPLPASWWRIVLAGALLFGVPALLGERTGSRGGPALYALVPLFVVVAVSTHEFGNGSRRLMLPGLVGAAGALLVLPFALPATLGDTGMLGVVLIAVACTAAGSVWLYTLTQGVELPAAVGLACSGTAVLLGIAGLGLERTAALSGLDWAREVGRTLAIDVPEVFLFLWLLRETRPERMAARSFFAPLVTVVEGLLLLRPGLDWRMVLGIALMVAGGGAMLLWKGDGGEEAPTSLQL